MPRPTLRPIRPFLILSAILLTGACASIGEGVPGSDDPNLPDSGLGPWVPPGDGDGDSDAGEGGDGDSAELVGTPTLLATGPNLGYVNVAMYSPDNGEYIGEFLTTDELKAEGGGGQPAHVAQGPDGNIYVADSTRDIVQVFTSKGEFVRKMTVDSPRALDFRGEDVFIATGKGRVAGFSGNGKPITDLVTLTSADYLEDILFLEDGRFLLANGRADAVELYDADGQFVETVFEIDFPTQIQATPDGSYVVASWSDNTGEDGIPGAVAAFDIDGNQLQRWDGPNVERARAVFPLANGNILISTYQGSCSDGGCKLVALDADSEVAATVQDGPAVRRIEVVLLPDDAE